jgi:serine protease inhibitor
MQFKFLILHIDLYFLGVVMMRRTMIINPRKTVFKADHPFVFLLKMNDNILFLGRFLKN